ASGGLVRDAPKGHPSSKLPPLRGMTRVTRTDTMRCLNGPSSLVRTKTRDAPTSGGCFTVTLMPLAERLWTVAGWESDPAALRTSQDVAGLGENRGTERRS